MSDEPTIESAREIVGRMLNSFVGDPPDSDFQAGYLECLYVIGREVLGMDLGPDPYMEEQAPPERRRPVLTLIKNDTLRGGT